MRWGEWYRHDKHSLRHRPSGLVASLDDLWSPATVAAFLEEHAAKLSTLDAVHLLVAANALQWESFDFTGIGDWTDENGIQRGRSEGVVDYIAARKVADA